MNINEITVVILTIWAVLAQGQPQYEVKVELPVTFTYRPGLSPMSVSYNNTLADGTCCSRNEEGTSCPTVCENRIILCFREAQHSEDDTNPAVCPLGEITFTPSVMGTGIITFNSTVLATTTTYPGSFQLYYRIIALSKGEEVESGRQTLTQPIQDRTLTLTGSCQFGGVRTQLFLNGLRVVCREGYFGPDCGCSPRDDSTGHFTCKTNGTKVCLPGYQNSETNCVASNETTDTHTDSATTATTKPASSTNSPASLPILPIAVGGAVGGLVVIALIIVAIIVIAFICKSKHKRNSDTKEENVVISTLITTTKESRGNSGNGGDVPPLYAQVNKENRTQKEEVPPIIPYQGDIYTEVEKTGLFASQNKLATNEQEYSTVSMNITPQIIYADLSLSNVPRSEVPSYSTHSVDTTYDNINTTEVQYSHIQK